MARKATGKPNGRPPKVVEVAKVLERARRTGESIEGAAKAEGVAPATVHAHKHRAGKGATAASTIKPTPSKPPGSTPSPAGNHGAALPQGGASTPPDLLTLCREILDARNPAARVMLDEGLRLHARGDLEAFTAWKLRPIERAEIEGDELDVLREGLGFALAVARTAEAGGPQLRALGILDRLAKSTSVVAARRPHEEGPDEVERRLVEIGDRAAARMGVIVGEEAAAFAAERAAVEAWLATLGPVGAEGVRRLQVLLDGPAESAEAA